MSSHKTKKKQSHKNKRE